MNEKQSPIPAAGQPAAGTPHHVTEQLKAERIQEMLRSLLAWELRPGGKEIERTWMLPGMRATGPFAGGVAAVVAELGHEATITLTRGWVRVVLTTAAVNGLTVKDFQIAAALEGGA